jgi:hypothetical protein
MALNQMGNSAINEIFKVFNTLVQFISLGVPLSLPGKVLLPYLRGYPQFLYGQGSIY